MTDYANHFSIKNIPFGIASNQSHPNKSVVTRFENTIILLDELAKECPPSSLDQSTIDSFSEPYLNTFASLPKSQHQLTRSWLQSLLTYPTALPPSTTSPLSQSTLHLPLQIGDFTDFSCSRDHVLNASEAVFGTRSLPPGFEHFPVGYHGRCSSIVVSGMGIVRPKGQFKDAEGKVVFGETRRLDYELEVGAVVRRGRQVEFGEGVALDEADEWIFGVVLVNDWSARDIQALEMTPLGPMNGKSFATSISPWVITLEALAPYKVSAPPRNPSVILPDYLQDSDPKPTYDLTLTASVQPANAVKASVICQSKFSSIYWTLRDLVAQQTINGCSLRTGDLLATGTISGGEDSSHGCLMEIAKKGGVDVMNIAGNTKKKVWFEDGDLVSISAIVDEGVGFGDCVGTIMPVT